MPTRDHSHTIPVLVHLMTAAIELLGLDTDEEVLQIMFCDKKPAEDGTPNAIVLASCPQEEVPELLMRAHKTLVSSEEGAPGAGKLHLDTTTGVLTEIPPDNPVSTDEVRSFVDQLIKDLPKKPTQ